MDQFLEPWDGIRQVRNPEQGLKLPGFTTCIFWMVSNASGWRSVPSIKRSTPLKFLTWRVFLLEDPTINPRKRLPSPLHPFQGDGQGGIYHERVQPSGRYPRPQSLV
jgi:hypothetical protein